MLFTKFSCRLALLSILLSFNGPSSSLATSSARDGWTSLPIPSLCLPGSSTGVSDGLRLGTHFDLGDADSDRDRDGILAFLPLVQLIELLEADARQQGTDLRCLRTAPPLLVRGSTAGIERARAVLLELDRAGRTQRIALKVTLAPESVPAGKTIEEFRHTKKFRLRSGESALVGDQLTRNFIADHDVEVASGVGTSYPVFGRVLTGNTAVLTAWRTPDGRSTFVSGTLDLAELLDISVFNPTSPDLGSLERPRVGSVEVSFSGLIQNEGELRVEVRGAPLSMKNWNLSIRAMAEPDQPDRWRIADLAWMEASAEMQGIFGPGAGLQLPRGHSAYAVENKSLTSAVMWAELQAAFVGRRSARPIFAIAPGILVALADDSQIWSELDPLMTAASQSRSATYPIRIDAGALTVQFSSAEGLHCTVRAGIETTVLEDYEVELAKDFWMADPQVERLFDGVTFQAQLQGGELIGSYWKSETIEINAFETGHGVVHLPQRKLSRGMLRVRAGDSSEVQPEFTVFVGEL
ncbi:MAG: hypothetical protein ACI8TQ_000452 [Planctomycetota bacterium]|jgi:hypothetical protein